MQISKVTSRPLDPQPLSAPPFDNQQPLSDARFRGKITRILVGFSSRPSSTAQIQSFPMKKIISKKTAQPDAKQVAGLSASNAPYVLTR
ncbi:hypothetical protein [Paludibacterium denitrificans]|uniref:Uncharacterized protein n=1 Tax=Paludibacterium denitrificans TaxID=2675226 RepID=A0A844GDY1_9NEIS|nr:hypothetical protein [Paludibacterium denitrificans]MTD33428.1 hypothetical protein [Paludibacterium denitrificans]